MDDFIVFLKSKRLYAMYMRECNSILHDYEIKHPTYVLLISFVWKRSAKGYNFWSQVNDDWNNYIAKNNKHLN